MNKKAITLLQVLVLLVIFFKTGAHGSSSITQFVRAATEHDHPTGLITFDHSNRIADGIGLSTVKGSTSVGRILVDYAIQHAPLMSSQWAARYGGNVHDVFRDVIMTSDGGFVAAGNTNSFGAGSYDGWIVKLNQDGTVAWQKTLEGTGNDFLRRLRQTNDGGYVIVGSSNSFGSGSIDAWIVRLSPEGMVVWQKTFGSPNLDSFRSVQNTSDGGYIVAGEMRPAGESSALAFVLRFDQQDNIIWQKTYDIGIAQTIKQTADGGFVVAGSSWVMKLDGNGNVGWAKTYNNGQTHSIYSIVQTNGGEYVTAGTRRSSTYANPDAWIMKLDTTGNVIWSKTYGGSGYEEVPSIAETTDGGLVFAGDTSSFGAGALDAWIVKLAADGNLLWQKTYGGGGYDHVWSVAEASGGDLILAADTAPTGGNFDSWVLKLDNDGEIAGCSLMGDSNITVANISTSVANIIPVVHSTSVTPADSFAISQSTSAQPEFVCEALPSISISHIEVTQGIQDVNNNIPLIAGKPTLVRVYLDCGADCTSVPGVTGELEVVSSNGQEVISPTPATVIVRHPLNWESQRPYPWTTLNFFLPLDLVEDSVTLNLTVPGASETWTESFASSPSFRIGYLPVQYDGVSPDPNRTAVAENFIEHVYPLAGVDYFEVPWALPYLGGIDADSLKRYLNTVVRWYDLFGWPEPNGEPDQLFGWVPHDTWGLGGSSDPTWFNGDGRVAFSSDTETTYPVYQMAMAHELGHNLGRHHPCNDPDSDWPYDDYAIHNVGFDFGFYAANSVVNDTTDDFMVGGHCGATVHDYKWTSAHTFERLHEALGSSSSVLEPLRSMEIPSGQPVLLVSGRAFIDNTAELQPSYQLTTTQAITQSMGTDYCLHLEDNAGGTLTSGCFDLSFIDVETQDPQPFASFVRILEYDSAAARLVLTQSASELVAQPLSSSAPAVTLASPNGGEVIDGSVNVTWTASDLDGDSLEYAVSYSADGGGSWYHLGIGLTDTNLLVDTTNLPGSSQVLFKVTVSDGINTDSDNSDDTLTVLSNSPRAVISNPHDGAVVPPERPVLLRGRGQDPEDGLLADSALSWFSSVDGNLGTGTTLLAHLTHGEHLITLTATDGDGKQGVATIQISVGHTIYLPSVRK